MPPWHIDKSVGIQEFKNDRSLTDAEIATVVKWVDAGAPKGDPKDLPAAKVWPTEQGWNFAKDYGQEAPDLVVKSLPWTHKAGANDAWWKPVVETGLTEPRWVRAIEIRPGTVRGRKITHHAIARLQQEETDSLAANPVDPNGNPLPGTFMEWAVGKQGEVMRPGSGKLRLPGSKIVWDIYYSNGGEEITDHVELGIYFYPKGQEPKHRQVLHLMGATNAGGVDIPPNSVKATEGYFVMRENGASRAFSPICICAGSDVDGSHPAQRANAGAEPRGQLQRQLAQLLRVCRHRGAAVAQGHAAEDHRVARQHGFQ